MEVDNIHVGDALTVLKTLPAESVNCVVTSPPYYGLRDYGCEGQIGLEDTPQAFIARLIAVFAEIKRVLRKDGVVWVNLGDSYNGSGKGYALQPSLNRDYQMLNRKTDIAGTAHKSLLMIPARFAIAMQDNGWILRSECVWVKPNPMPESVTDRPTKSHEMVYLFAKSPKYWYDADAIREPHEQSTIERVKSGGRAYGHSEHQDETGKVASGGWGKTADKNAQIRRLDPLGRNRRDVFTVNSEPTPFAHFATFPQALIEPLILAGCPEKVCAECGKPYVRVIEKSGVDRARNLKIITGKSSAGVNEVHKLNGKDYVHANIATNEFRPSCTCIAVTRAGVCLDPFVGSGTVPLVARKLGRHYIGIDLNPDYAELAMTRLTHISKEETNNAINGKPHTIPMF